MLYWIPCLAMRTDKCPNTCQQLRSKGINTLGDATEERKWFTEDQPFVGRGLEHYRQKRGVLG